MTRARGYLGWPRGTLPFERDSLAFQKSLAETVEWCFRQPLTAKPEETAETREHRRKVEEANQLIDLARKRASRSLFRRDTYKRPEWKRAFELLGEARPDLIAPLEEQLRSPALRPHSTLGNIDRSEFEQGLAIDEIISRAESNYSATVADVVGRRSGLLEAEGSRGQLPTDPGQMGRLLLYWPGENVADGASKYGSQGFFDENDCPPLGPLGALH